MKRLPYPKLPSNTIIMPGNYFVYIISNKNKTVLYTGITNNLVLRLQQHASDANGARMSFAGRYACFYLLYFEDHQNVQHAIAREKQIKGWTRAKKMVLIETINPGMVFLNIS